MPSLLQAHQKEQQAQLSVKTCAGHRLHAALASLHPSEHGVCMSTDVQACLLPAPTPGQLPQSPATTQHAVQYTAGYSIDLATLHLLARRQQCQDQAQQAQLRPASRQAMAALCAGRRAPTGAAQQSPLGPTAKPIKDCSMLTFCAATLQSQALQHSKPGFCLPCTLAI